MNKKLILKMIIANMLVGFILFGCMFLFLLIWPSLVGGFIGFILGLALVIEIIRKGYTVWFKDYIEEYWRKEEEKNAQTEKKESQDI